MILEVNKLLSRILSLFIVLIAFSCNEQVKHKTNSCDEQVRHKTKNNTESSYFEIRGFAQGSTYSVIYQDSTKRDFLKEIDSILSCYDLELSIYNDASLLSEFNQSVYTPYCMVDQSQYLRSCFIKAKDAYHQTNGAFNPAIYPLVSYWGFYDDSMNKTIANPNEIDSLLRLISFDDEAFFLTIDTITKGNILLDSSPVICKTILNSKLDFNGIAQGHSVDVVSCFIENQGVKNYMVEIGGEIRARGLNHKNSSWKIGIDKPVDNSSPGSEGFQVIIELTDNSLATSGNYRKFYKRDGVKYSHTIDPESGYPVQHSLLSVSVICNETALADAYATAFMVMGVERSIEFIESNKELEINAYFVYSNKKGENKVWMTAGMEGYIAD